MNYHNGLLSVTKGVFCGTASGANSQIGSSCVKVLVKSGTMIYVIFEVKLISIHLWQ
jgi:hypothetical protein